MTHHVLALKVPLAQAVEGQLLTSLLAHQLAHNTTADNNRIQHNQQQQQQLAGTSGSPASTSTARSIVTPPRSTQVCNGSSSSSPPQGDMLLLPPVAVRGCFQLLLAVAAPRAADSSFSMPIRQLVAQLGLSSSSSNSPQQITGSQSPQQLGAAGGSSSSSRQLALQVNSQGPVVVARQGDGAWRVAGAAAAAADDDTEGFSNASAVDGQSFASMGCWLQPACLSLAAAGEGAAAGFGSSSSSSSSEAALQVIVCGLPAAAGPAVRVLLVQGAAVAADQVVLL